MQCAAKVVSGACKQITNIGDVGDTQTVATELGLIACRRDPAVLCTPFTDVNLQGPTAA